MSCSWYFVTSCFLLLEGWDILLIIKGVFVQQNDLTLHKFFHFRVRSRAFWLQLWEIKRKFFFFSFSCEESCVPTSTVGNEEDFFTFGLGVVRSDFNCGNEEDFFTFRLGVVHSDVNCVKFNSLLWNIRFPTLLVHESVTPQQRSGIHENLSDFFHWSWHRFFTQWCHLI